MRYRKRRERDVTNSGPKQLLALSPWGVAGGYSGPLVLQDRLMGALMDEGGISITVLYRDRGLAKSPAWVSTPVPVVASPAESFPKSKQVIWLIRSSLHCLRNRRRFDAFFLQGAYLLNSIPGLFLSRRTRIIVLPVVDGGDLAIGRGNAKNFIKSVIQSRLFSRSMLGICLSTGIKNDFLRLGVPERSLRLAYNLVDTELYCPSPTGKNHGTAEYRLLFVGVLGKRKQPHLLVEACAGLRSAGIDATVTLVGPYEDADYRRMFEQSVERLGLDGVVHVVGLSSFPLPYYQQADVFVLPSQSEGMPGAMSEALACGLPVVVSSVGAMPEVVQAADCGLVVSDSDVEQWTAALETLYRHPVLANQMSLNGRQFAEKYMSPHILALDVCRFIFQSNSAKHNDYG